MLCLISTLIETVVWGFAILASLFQRPYIYFFSLLFPSAQGLFSILDLSPWTSFDIVSNLYPRFLRTKGPFKLVTLLTEDHLICQISFNKMCFLCLSFVFILSHTHFFCTLVCKGLSVPTWQVFVKVPSLHRKARRKDRDNPAALEQEHKLYLEEAVLERKIPETDLRQLVELPPGLGYEEWLASHSKYLAVWFLNRFWC